LELDVMPRKKRSPGLAEEQREREVKLPERIDLTLGPGGRIVIPAVYRKAMEVEEGGRLMARVVDGELRLLTPQMGIRRAQKMVRETIPPDVDLVEALFEERRWEVAQELEDD
jgi:bifunctional DNA-binding transcriptional regulator/antitoxin component of YhaV-PrlF toxin-antitoxin module